MSSLIILAISGNNDKYLIDNPNITYFKKVYKKHTNFHIETLTQNFKQDFDFDKLISCEISKVGDLLIDAYVYIKINNINEYIDPLTNEIDEYARFSWSRKLGFSLINKAELEIGGNIIETLYGDWLNVWYELTETSHKSTIDKMIGNIPEIYSFSKTKEDIELFIPLYFWFKNSNLALPILSIKYHNINLNLYINKKNKICNMGHNRELQIDDDIVYFKENEIIEQNFFGKKILGLFINFNNLTKTINYIKINKEFEIPSNNNNINNKYYYIKGIESDFSTIPISDTSIKNKKYNYNISIDKINLVTTYVYLDIDDKKYFENNSHQYLINIVQYSFHNTKINKNLNFKLNFYNSCREIIWLAKLKYNSYYDIFNYSTSISNKDKKSLIKKSNLYFNDINIVKVNSFEYFNYIIPYYYHSNIPDLGINCYNFCLNCESIQPNGSINLSKLNNINLTLDFDDFINEEAEVIIFNNSYNILKIQNGIASLLFNT